MSGAPSKSSLLGPLLPPSTFGSVANPPPMGVLSNMPPAAPLGAASRGLNNNRAANGAPRAPPLAPLKPFGAGDSILDLGPRRGVNAIGALGGGVPRGPSATTPSSFDTLLRDLEPPSIGGGSLSKAGGQASGGRKLGSQESILKELNDITGPSSGPSLAKPPFGRRGNGPSQGADPLLSAAALDRMKPPEFDLPSVGGGGLPPGVSHYGGRRGSDSGQQAPGAGLGSRYGSGVNPGLAPIKALGAGSNAMAPIGRNKY
eukprot:gene15462-21546_t